MDTEKKALEKFLEMPVNTAEEVLAAFRDMDGVIEDHGNGKEGYLYVPGKRSDRCVIAAHADTYFDEIYQDAVLKSKIGFRDGCYYSEAETCGIGADDRAGCAMVWLLRNSGHSLLLLDGEEHGQIGAHYLKESNLKLFEEINDHNFIIQLDRRGNNDYKYYQLPVPDEFIDYVEAETGYILTQGRGRTDICTLCTRACGVNLSIGYYNEHTPDEILVYDEWLNTYNIGGFWHDGGYFAGPLMYIYN